MVDLDWLLLLLSNHRQHLQFESWVMNYETPYKQLMCQERFSFSFIVLYGDHSNVYYMDGLGPPNQKLLYE